MKLIVPDYYPRFQCIADRCKHSCCIGWEIDIDENSLARYAAIDGALGQRLQDEIDRSGDAPHFRLAEGERCPFLNESGLCDLITELGEDSLCQICADHPRFRNEFSDHTEMGLGLCCEAAAELILTKPDPVMLITLAEDGGDDAPDDEEWYLSSVRDNAMAIVQDRAFTVAERIDNLSDFYGFVLPEQTPSKWAEFYLELERLDEHWTELLTALKSDFTATVSPEQETAWEQLLVYFIYRHLPAALIDGDISSKLKFAVLSVTMLQWLQAATGEPLHELARMYSSEIEYSDENLDILFDELYEE
ncbi:MAG: flagellin lysine-N-methylase [Oscillospiraceae bacterium]|nr:flagellin lysine-N-methylase [Oscillospiraceae bacterium]